MTKAALAVGVALGMGAALIRGHHTRSETAPAAALPRVEPPSAAVSARGALVPRGAPEAPTPSAVSAPPPLAAPAGAEATLAAIPGSSMSVPSCRELLGSAFIEKSAAAAAYDETLLGTRQLVHGNLDAAQRAYCNASLWDRGNVERWLNLSQLFLLRRDATQAGEAARAALALQPENARALNLAGDAWAMLGKPAEARAAYLAAEKRGEPDAKTLRLLVQRDFEEASRSAALRDYARAERLFRRVVVFAPEHAAASSGVASCLAKLGQAQLAETWTRRSGALRSP
jgi:tetratricopeptide (TPR) repeat protein